MTERVSVPVRPSSNRWFIAAGVALILFKLWLVAGQSILAVGYANFDDALFIKLARNILGGRWLGDYNELTLAKGPMYSLFISGVFLLGIPLFTAQHLLYIAACSLASSAMRPLVANRWVLFALFVVLLFNPVTYDASTHARVLRQDILHALVLMILAALIALYARRKMPKKKLLPWIVVLGITLPAFWMTREEGVWLMPCVGMLWIFTGWRIWQEKPSDRLSRLALMVLPALMWIAGLSIVSGLNKYYYGVYTTCEFRLAEFKDAYGALLRVKPKEWHPYIPVRREVRERLYAVSPSFAELRPFLDGPSGEAWAGTSEFVTHLPREERELAGGWFMWALRGAVVAAGHGKSGEDAMHFYQKVAQEINTACDNGLLEAGSRRSGFLPPLRKEYWAPFSISARKAGWFLISFEQIVAKAGPSAGSPEDLAHFSELTRGRLSPTQEGPPIPKKQLWLDTMRLNLLQDIINIYRDLSPWTGIAAMLAVIGVAFLAAIRRHLHFWLVVSIALLGVNVGLVVIVALLDITAGPAINSGYFTGGYGLWLLFMFTSGFAVHESLALNSKPLPIKK